MYAKRVDSNVIYEFDCLEELREFDNTYFVDSGSKLMKMIASELNTTEGELSKFAPITKEDLSKGFTFTSDCRQNGFRGYTLKPFCCNISNYENHLSIK